MEIVKNRPEWWPICPYPSSIFTMTENEYVEATPDPHLRTRISGFLMRRGWEVAEGMIHDSMVNSPDFEPEKKPVCPYCEYIDRDFHTMARHILNKHVVDAARV